MWIWLPIFLTWCNLATAAAGFLIPLWRTHFVLPAFVSSTGQLKTTATPLPPALLPRTVGTLGTVRWVRWVRYGRYGGYGTMVRWVRTCTHRTVPIVPACAVPTVPTVPYRTQRTIPTVPTVPRDRTSVPRLRTHIYRKCPMYLPVLNHQKTCTFLRNAANCEAVGSSASSGGAPIVTMKFWYHLSTSDASGGNNSDSSCWSMGTHFEYPLFDSTWNPCWRFLSNYVSWGTFRLAPWVHVLELCLAEPWLEGYHPCDHNRDEQGKKTAEWFTLPCPTSYLLVGAKTIVAIASFLVDVLGVVSKPWWPWCT